MSETTIQHSQNFLADCTKCYWNDLFRNCSGCLRIRR